MENTQKNQPKQEKQGKLTYDELNRTAADLYQQNQRLLQQMRAMQEALDEKDFQYTTFFLSSLFKVVEHPEAYRDDFVVWGTECIENLLASLGKGLMRSDEKAEPKENADESE